MMVENTIEVTTLIVHGTLDPTAKRRGGILNISKLVEREHPTDKGYFKKVYVLSPYGKKLLIRKVGSMATLYYLYNS